MNQTALAYGFACGIFPVIAGYFIAVPFRLLIQILKDTNK